MTDNSTLNILTYKQKIANNLSSKQIVTILNALINAAAEPLFKNSHLMRQLILQALLQTQSDHRRKISIYSKPVTAACIIQGVAHNDYNTIKFCELDRNILLKSILYIQPYLQQAIIIEQKLIKNPKSLKYNLRMQKICNFVGINRKIITPLARWVFPYLDLYLQFKERIIAKFIKLMRQEANKARSYTRLFVDSDELFNNYLLAMDKAIDKFDANRGTLTVYIKNWTLSARSAPEFDHQYGVAYTLPANVRKDLERNNVALTNMSVTLDDTHSEIEDVNMSNKMQDLAGKDTLFLKCLRNIKGIKIPYLLADIPIVLNEQEITKLRGM